MSTTTLTVPAKYADDFRTACAHELAAEGRATKKARTEYLEAVALEGLSPRKADDSEWRGVMKMLDRDAAIFRQAFAGTGDIEISVDDDQGCVEFAAETVARKIVGPQLTDALNVGPIDAAYAKELHTLIDRLTWAVDAAAEINAGYAADRKRRREQEGEAA